jgi:hypothetical protein
MTSHPSPSTRSLKEIMKHVPTSDELTTTLLDLNRQKNARASAITLAALLESALESALRTKLISNPPKESLNNLFGLNRILSTFWAKTEIAFALGLIGPQTRKDLDRVRTIRNAFAHAKGIITFETQAIATECRQLKFSGRDLFKGYKPPSTAEDKYRITATILMQLFGSLPTVAKDPSLSPHWLPLIRQ